MLPSTAARGLRRAELVSSAPLAAAAFHEKLLGWRAVQTAESRLDCWVGERRCASVRAPLSGEPTGWRVVFAGADEDSSLVGPDDVGAEVAQGRAQHGPWAPAPRLSEPCWVDLFTQQPQRADDFWTERLHWSRAADLSEQASTYTCEGRPVAARMHAQRSDGRWDWLCYFAVRNVDVAEERVPELGGEVVEWVKHPVVGTAVVVADPQGAVYALTPHTHQWGAPVGQLVS